MQGRKGYGRRLDMAGDLLREEEEAGKGNGEAMRRCFAQMGIGVPKEGEGGGKVSM